MEQTKDSKSIFAVTILGCNSAVPAFNRHPTAQIVTIANECILIDCGEATLLQMMKYKIKKSKLKHILISHLHGDHYFGLIALITTMGLLGRKDSLHIYAPKLLQPIIELQLNAANTILPYALIFHAIEQEGLLVNENKFRVHCFATKHRIECWGFIVHENKEPRKLWKEKAVEYNIPLAFYKELKKGKNYITKDGTTIKNEIVTLPNTPEKKYVYSADTLYNEDIFEKIQQADLLYHEATYLSDLEDRATQRYHCTAKQAATVAKKTGTKKLIMGHFSSKYEDVQPFLTEASAIFSNTALALEGITFKI